MEEEKNSKYPSIDEIKGDLEKYLNIIP